VLAVHVLFAVDVEVNTMLVPVVTEEEGVETDTSEMMHASACTSAGEIAKTARANKSEKTFLPNQAGIFRIPPKRQKSFFLFRIPSAFSNQKPIPEKTGKKKLKGKFMQLTARIRRRPWGLRRRFGCSRWQRTPVR
jgi:hypothetical protein